MLQKIDAINAGEINLLTSFFNGECRGRGIVIDRLGNVRARIQVTMTGKWGGERFVMDEVFVHEDGRIETRSWTVVTDLAAAGRFSASCPEMATPARGNFTASTVRMNYNSPVPVSGRMLTLSFDDRMYKVSENTLFERASMKKFGLRVADIFLTFEKSS